MTDQLTVTVSNITFEKVLSFYKRHQVIGIDSFKAPSGTWKSQINNVALDDSLPPVQQVVNVIAAGATHVELRLKNLTTGHIIFPDYSIDQLIAI